ncbi:di-heme oxidoredictase family protein [Paracoccus sp. 1_MG-2023]|uniref:di-heme oxidoreductase family protein n=2 Tax=unclassified Paracoccus (in: a-proteobacteria) TaxID=2688777 RepID=UPI002091664E|nr:di-heme oxidoredictase family protein [Paracoccus sp. C2R09]MDO6668466.1 di-heme oxidoredictase family protein [Paracoccus sp. 1_MG-2023]
MPSSSKIMRHVLPLLMMTAAPVLAEGPALADLHLDATPRTQAEAARIADVVAPTRDFTAPEPFEGNPGGAATVRLRDDADAFSQSSANIGFEGELRFKVGNGLFRKLWVSSPASTLASDGLGPLYNSRGCQNCHLKDGRGHPPEGHGDPGGSMFLRLSVPAAENDRRTEIEEYLAGTGNPFEPTRPDPVYGGQLQDLSVAGIPAEGRMTIDYTESRIELSGGEVAHLRAPSYGIDDPAYGPLRDDLMISPRVAPPMIGLGLLEAIPADDILADADPEDADGDGISGRANIVWSARNEAPMLGRFGWKAGMPTIEEQSASAFSGDIGISNPLHPEHAGECTDAQAACRAAPNGGGDARGTEIDAEGLELTVFYSQNLAVPARRDEGDPQVLRGKQVFYDAGCADCHRPKHVTARMEDRPEHSFQLIWPYTDMLLHDMGEGLADHRPEGLANGREWRTQPLWGVGLTEQVNGHGMLLHDGRARSVLEAILWHGGEAAPARDTVIDIPPEDRAALIRFVESL